MCRHQRQEVAGVAVAAEAVAVGAAAEAGDRPPHQRRLQLLPRAAAVVAVEAAVVAAASWTKLSISCSRR